MFTGKTWKNTFSDGSEHAYGTLMYPRWNVDQGLVVRLVESKVKLTPLDHRGDAVKAERYGAVFSLTSKTLLLNTMYCLLSTGEMTLLLT